MLNECAAALQANPEGLAKTLTMEQGKPLAKAAEELMGTAMWCSYTASLQMPNEVISDTANGRIEIRRKPVGVVAAITPWNYPLMLAMWKLAPALLAGNTVVLKPSPFTPITSLMLGEILRDIIPPGVFNVVSGGDELGAMMTSHPVPRKLSFTGSVETGKHVAAAAAPDLKRFTLELGGNDAAIILPDVDPKAVAQKIFWGAFENNGQICSAIKRVYVPEDKYNAMLDQLSDIAKTVKVGDGLAEGNANRTPEQQAAVRARDRAGRRREEAWREDHDRRRADGQRRIFLSADHRREHFRWRAAGRRGAVRPGAADHRI